MFETGVHSPCGTQRPGKPNRCPPPPLSPPIAELEAIESLEGQWVQAAVNPAGDVMVNSVEAPVATAAAGGAAAGRAAPKVTLGRTTAGVGRKGGKWVLEEGEFSGGTVGGKSLNLAALRAKLPLG